MGRVFFLKGIMTVFHDSFKDSMNPRLLERHGESVTHISAEDDSETVVSSYWVPEGQERDNQFDGDSRLLTGRLTVNPDSIANTITENDSFTIRSEVWSVKTIRRTDPLTVMEMERRKQRQVGAVGTFIER